MASTGRKLEQTDHQRNPSSNNEDSVFDENNDRTSASPSGASNDKVAYVSQQTSTVSSSKLPFRTQKFSDGPAVCRICHGGELSSPFLGGWEELISPCHCSGTMGLYHRSCLEKWLSTSNTVNCEICNFQFITERHPKPFLAFLNNPGNLSHRRSMIGDAICWCILTPLAISSAFLCIQGAVHYSHQEKDAVEVPGLVCLAVFLILTYLIWFSVSLRYHYKVWREWQKGNQVVKIVDREKVMQQQSRLSFTVSTDGNNNRNTIIAEGGSRDSRSHSHSALSIAARPPAHTSTPADIAPSATVTIRFQYEPSGSYYNDRDHP